ncbi:MAG: S9 family peptidase [Anaerolineales bacterium]|nr:S9 family peptidase [Chloroflexota bacterium]MBL6980440.1 S9 family peptidase [Anaerolineales bacterium]
MPINYPPTQKSDIVDNYHGTQIPDPYRWLEDADEPQVKTWTEAQNQLTHKYLEKIPALEKIKARLTELWNFPKYETLKKVGGKYFFTKNDGLQNQAALYIQDTFDANPRHLIDPNFLSDDGTIALMEQYYSKDGSTLAYTLAASGSDWQEIHLLDTASGEKLSDVLQWCRFPTIAWKPDKSGFYYNRQPEPSTVASEDQNHYVKVYFHMLDTHQSSDKLIFENPADKSLRYYPFASNDGKFLYLFTMRGTDRRNGLYLRPMESEGNFLHLAEDGEAKFIYIGNSNSIFYFMTDLSAPRGRVIAIDVENPGREHWEEIIPQGTDALEEVKLVNQHFILFKKHHAHSRISIHNIDGTHIRDIPLPGMGTASYLSGGQSDRELFFSFESFLHPQTIFCYSFESGELAPFLDSPLGFDVANYETNQVFYPSKDGTQIPMFLTHRKGLVLNGDNPTILYAYGGFNISQTPFFNVWNLIWLEMGGVFALANIRGGDEYGEDWHRAGMLDKKQNCFDDFIAAAEWLIENDYTRTEKLAIEGRSNGGLLTSACMVQRPDLYGAILCWVPVTDMLRYHKFTIGHFWTVEWGNAEENGEDFEYLYAYSPLHNVKEVDYPPIIIPTADSDDRVVPAHSKKFIATLQEKSTGANPMLLRVDTKAGHKLGKPTYKLIDEHADVLAFVVDVLGVNLNL